MNQPSGLLVTALLVAGAVAFFVKRGAASEPTGGATDDGGGDASDVAKMVVPPCASDEARDAAEEVARIVMGWDRSARVKTTRMLGGNTNVLWLVRGGSSRDRRSCLVRVFGANTESIIDRERESAVFAHLARHGVAPALHGEFANGRVEEFVDGKTLTPEMLATSTPIDFIPLVAREMARMHAIEDFPVSSPSSSSPSSSSSPDKAWRLWTTLDAWMEEALRARFPNNDARRLALKELDLDGFVAEIAWLRSILPSPDNFDGLTLPSGVRGSAAAAVLAVAFRSVFAHNDLVASNILFVEESSEGNKKGGGRVQFIDFEYGGWNPVTFDVANCFCEFAGFEFVDPLDKYPSVDTQRRFWRAYLGACHDSPLSSGVHDVDAVIDGLVYWTTRFAPAADAAWMLWAVVQGHHSQLEDVDFLAYAKRRRGGFFERKARIVGEQV